MGKKRKNQPGYRREIDKNGHITWVPEQQQSTGSTHLADARSDFSSGSVPSPAAMPRRRQVEQPQRRGSGGARSHGVPRDRGSRGSSAHRGTKFRSDLRENEVVEAFLDKEIYPLIFDSVERKTDLDSQFAGIDIIADGMKIDEKAQANYKNRNLPTNAFEISSLSKKPFYQDGVFDNHPVDGWFINEELETEKYLIISFTGVDGLEYDRDRMHDPDQIYSIEAHLVDKYDLIDEVEQEAELDDLYETGEDMRENGQKAVERGKIRLVCSQHLAEKPVSLIWKKRHFPSSTRTIKWNRDEGVTFDSQAPKEDTPEKGEEPTQ